MSSATTNAVLSAILQLSLAFIMIAAFVQIRNSYLEYSFMDRAEEICNFIRTESAYEGNGKITTYLDLPAYIAGKRYALSFNNTMLRITGRKNFTCTIPWLYGSFKTGGKARVEI